MNLRKTICAQKAKVLAFVYDVKTNAFGGDHVWISVYPSVRFLTSISDKTIYGIFTKLGMGVIYKNLLRKF
jgi:hypothetical protein